MMMTAPAGGPIWIQAVRQGNRIKKAGGIVYRFAKLKPGIGQWNKFQQALKVPAPTASKYYQTYQGALGSGIGVGIRTSVFAEQISEFGYNALGGQGPTFTPGGFAGDLFYRVFGNPLED